MRPRSKRYLNPPGLRVAQYETFLEAFKKMAPDILENFWTACWSQVRDAPPERCMVEPLNVTTRWLIAGGLTGPDGEPPQWLRESFALALIGRAEAVRLYGEDPGPQPFGAGGCAVVPVGAAVLPVARRLQFRCLVQPARGLTAERARILAQFERWLDERIAEIGTAGLVEALGEEAEIQAIRLWIATWLKRVHGRDVEVRAVEERHRRRLIRWASEALELALPRGRRAVDGEKADTELGS